MHLFDRRLFLLLGTISLATIIVGTTHAYLGGRDRVAAGDEHDPILDDHHLAGQLPDHHQGFLADIEPAHQLDAMTETPCTDGFADIYPCHNVDLLALLPLASIGGGSGNDIWGWTDPLDGKEYAIMGRSSGTAFVDISDPANPIYLGNLPTHSSNSSWRDIKVYADHAFVVSEASSHGMQVFDLLQLRNVTSPPVTFTATAHYNSFGRAHNVAINEESGYAYAVGIGQGTFTCSGGLHMINIQNPLSPTFAGCYALDGYIHDTQCVIYNGPDSEHQGKEVCFNSNGSNTVNAFTIVDVSVKNAPVRLAQRGYAGRGYAHQGWLTEDHRYFLLDDELDEQQFGHNTRTYIWDVSDLDEPLLLGHYNGTTAAIDHNQYIVGDHSFQANYRSGLRILRLADLGAATLEETAFFDIYPASDSPNFNGAWSVYPFFESGVVVVSGIEQGLFVLRPQLGPILTLTKSEPAGTVAIGETITYTLNLSNSGTADATGVVVTDTLNGVAVVLSGPDTITAGSDANYYFVYDIQPEDCITGLTNWAEASSNEGATAVLPAPIVTPVACPAPELSIDMSQPQGEHQPGQPITYTISVTNSGSIPATGVIVTATLNGAATVVAGPDLIATGATASYLFAYTLQAADCDTSLEAWAAVESNEGAGAQLVEPVVTPIVCPAPELSIDMSQPQGEHQPGQPITYTISVTNSGSAPATGVIVTATLNGAATVVAGPHLIATGATASYLFAYTLQAADCDTSLEAWAAVESNEGAGAQVVEPVVTPIVCPAPELSISMGQPQGTVKPGSWISYTITVSNEDSWQATGIVVTATINGQVMSVPGPLTIAGNSQADYSFLYLVAEADCTSGLIGQAVATSANGGSVALEEPVMTAVQCDYQLFLPFIQQAIPAADSG